MCYINMNTDKTAFLKKMIGLNICYKNGFLIMFVVFTFGCGSKNLQTPPNTEIGFYFKKYKRVIIETDKDDWTSTNIAVNKGDRVLLFTSGMVTPNNGESSGIKLPAHKVLNFKIGIGQPFKAVDSNDQYYFKAPIPGTVKFGIAEKTVTPVEDDYKGQLVIELILLTKDQEGALGENLIELAEANPNNEIFKNQVNQFLNSKAFTEIENNKIWEEYRLQDTLTGYLEYLKQYSGHQNRFQALERIDKIIYATYQKNFWQLEARNLINTDNHLKSTLSAYQSLLKTGSPDVEFVLADINYLFKNKTNDKAAFILAQNSADKGILFGRLLLSKFYYNGFGTIKDKKKATELLFNIKSDIQAFLLSQSGTESHILDTNRALIEYFLGWLYGQGLGVSKDPFLAFLLYNQAAGNGNLPAKYNTALALLRGMGTKKNIRLAENIIGEFALAGFKKAQSNLAWMYQNQQSSGQYFNTALKYYLPDEDNFWEHINKETYTKAAYFDIYLKRFPDGKHMPVARAKFKVLTSIEATSVVDDITKLIWQKKASDKMDWQSASQYCNQLISAEISDWRLPDIAELKASIPFFTSQKTLQGGFHWSSNFGSYIPAIYFESQEVRQVKASSIGNVRCVTGHRAIHQPSVNELVYYDAATGLVWQRANQDKMDWAQANRYCQELSLIGKNNWRVPTNKEWLSAFKIKNNLEYYPTTYWSASAYDGSENTAWGIKMSDGSMKHDTKSNMKDVSCVLSY